MERVWVYDSLDDLQIRHVRLLECAATHGPVHLLLWSDRLVEAITGRPPKFPLAERQYAASAIRYVAQVHVRDEPVNNHVLPLDVSPGHAWVTTAAECNEERRITCAKWGVQHIVIDDDTLAALPPIQAEPTPRPDATDHGPSTQTDNRRQPAPADRKKVVVTGCYDWFHTGHIRFFEEASEYGDLYVVVGHDRNVRTLKGPGHPMFNEHQRWYMVQAIRYVTAALVSSGSGWMDAEPEIRRIRPDRYIVNEDGDRPEKRRFCAEHGIEYIVLKRLPKEGLPRRESTHLRGF